MKRIFKKQKTQKHGVPFGLVNHFWAWVWLINPVCSVALHWRKLPSACRNQFQMGFWFEIRDGTSCQLSPLSAGRGLAWTWAVLVSGSSRGSSVWVHLSPRALSVLSPPLWNRCLSLGAEFWWRHPIRMLVSYHLHCLAVASVLIPIFCKKLLWWPSIGAPISEVFVWHPRFFRSSFISGWVFFVDFISFLNTTLMTWICFIISFNCLCFQSLPLGICPRLFLRTLNTFILAFWSPCLCFSEWLCPGPLEEVYYAVCLYLCFCTGM